MSEGMYTDFRRISMDYEGLFITLAEMAITANYEIELEKKDLVDNGNSLGCIVKKNYRDNGISLTARPLMSINEAVISNDDQEE